MLQRKPKILIVYKCLGYPLRLTVDEHLYSFRRYADAECYYLMLDIGKETYNSSEPIPSYLLKVDYDIILFHYGFVSSRWAGKQSMENAIQQVMPLIGSKAIKAVLTQDEYKNSIELNDFINRFKINVVFTLATNQVARQIFDEVDFEKVRFYRVLTGYIDDKSVRRYRNSARRSVRTIDIGYRARNLPQWLGRHGYMKSQIADIFNEASKKFGLKTDISIKPEDTLMGKKWPEFLLKCKYMIGVEGGATILDKDGSIWKKGTEYLKEHPDCTFEEIEAACFPGLDGKLELINISPRHLECIVTRTCQVMLESTFNGILEADKHYIAVKNDFSNLDHVLQKLKDDDLREQITENAYRDIVLSGKWSYRTMVKDTIEKCFKEANDPYFERNPRSTKLLYIRNRINDKLAWRKYYFWDRIYPSLPSKWVFLNPLITIVKYSGMKYFAKKLYFLFTGRKDFLKS